MAAHVYEAPVEAKNFINISPVQGEPAAGRVSAGGVQALVLALALVFVSDLLASALAEEQLPLEIPHETLFNNQLQSGPHSRHRFR